MSRTRCKLNLDLPKYNKQNILQVPGHSFLRSLGASVINSILARGYSQHRFVVIIEVYTSGNTLTIVNITVQ